MLTNTVIDVIKGDGRENQMSLRKMDAILVTLLNEKMDFVRFKKVSGYETAYGTIYSISTVCTVIYSLI